MHRVNRLPRAAQLILIFIGIFSSVLRAEIEVRDPDQLAKEHLVFVEPSFTSTSAKNGEFALLPYHERRQKWGLTASLEYSSYEPIHFEPNFGPGSYRDIYGVPSTPMIEIQLSGKRNLKAGSLGGELAVGMFENAHSDPNFVHSTLALTTVRLGANFNFDMIGTEPFAVPFVSAGVYTMLFRESRDKQAFNGRTQPAPYLIGGFAFSMDWIDRKAARKAYLDSGVQSSFLVLEARKFFRSANENDPDFSNDINWAAGLRLEF